MQSVESTAAVMTPSSFLRRWRLGSYTLLLARYSPHQKLPLHAHQEDSLTVVLQGDLLEEAGRESVAAVAGWSSLRPRGLRHANRVGPRGAVVLGILPDAVTFEELPRRWHWTTSVLAYRAGLRLLRGDEEALLELMSEVIPCGRPDLYAARRALRLAEDMSIPVGEIARTLGVHPIYLARQFRAAFGVSIREYRAVLRVRRAADLLLSSHRTLRRVAHECGFADQSHMCRAFRRVVGEAPGVLFRC